MKLLITGGAGFIGTSFVYYMHKKYPNYNIICLDSLTYAGNLNNLVDIMNDKNFKFIKGDIVDRDFVFSLFEKEKFDYVINFAAESHVDRSIGHPEIFLQTNVIGTQVLMAASLKYKVKRFHQVSTDEVYGDLPLDKPGLYFTELSQVRPSSPYSASKAAADLLALSYHRCYDLNVTISRCSNNYGPYQFLEKLIPIVIVNGINNKKIPVHGSGDYIRDWIHVDDHCRAIDLIVHEGKSGEVYNVGANSEKTNVEIMKLILKKLNKSESLMVPAEDRKGQDVKYALDFTKIQKELGWCPEVDFEDGINKTIDWYLNNKDWWEDILTGNYKNIERE